MKLKAGIVIGLLVLLSVIAATAPVKSQDTGKR